MSSAGDSVGAPSGGVLCRAEIKKLLASGQLTIEPAPEASSFGPASVDLHLHNEFRLFKNRIDVVDVNEDVDFNEYTEKVVLEEGEKLLLLPGCACLAITRETIHFPKNVAGMLEGRSRFARLGLSVHVTAGFISPGVNNRTVLEIFNASPLALHLIPGVRIAQMVFFTVVGDAEPYAGRFERQEHL
jgi:dCTP deaminase